MSNKNYRILLVEDNPITTMSLSLFLKDENFQVVEEVTYAEGLADKLLKLEVDIIIMDIMLKGSDTGLDAAKTVRQHSEIPILFVSALSDSETIEQINSISNSDYLTKPFEYSVFKKVIIDLIEGNY